MDLEKSMMVSASALRAQSARIRIIAENIANQGTVASVPGGDPYRRKLITFESELDRAMGVELVQPGRVRFDEKEFNKDYDPTNPAADDEGYVKVSNVNGLIEMMDMRQAQRSYQANLNALEGSRRMATQTVQLLRGR